MHIFQVPSSIPHPYTNTRNKKSCNEYVICYLLGIYRSPWAPSLLLYLPKPLLWRSYPLFHPHPLTDAPLVDALPNALMTVETLAVGEEGSVDMIITLADEFPIMVLPPYFSTLLSVLFQVVAPPPPTPYLPPTDVVPPPSLIVEVVSASINTP